MHWALEQEARSGALQGRMKSHPSAADPKSDSTGVMRRHFSRMIPRFLAGQKQVEQKREMCIFITESVLGWTLLGGKQAPSCMPEALGLIPDPRGGRGTGRAGVEEGGKGKEQEGKAGRIV